MNDLRFALRQLLKNPGFTAVAVLTLALGIGCNTAFFSLLYGVVLKAPPYPDAGRLVEIRNLFRDNPDNSGRLSLAELFDYRARQSSFVGIGGSISGRATLAAELGAERVQVTRVTANLLPLLGVRPVRGRDFTEAEEHAGHDSVAVVSHDFWQSHLGGSEGVLGHTIRLNGVEHTIVGVMPAGFSYPEAGISIWKPLDLNPRGKADRDDHSLQTTARLAAGISPAQAREDLLKMSRQLQADLPEAYPRDDRWKVGFESLREARFGQMLAPLGLLSTAAAGVLLIACVNVSIMFLLRAAMRRREMLIRSALGARRGQLIRQLLTESAVVCSLGAAAGMVVAAFALEAFRSFSPEQIPRLEEVRLNGTAALFTAGVLMLVTLLVGLAPVVSLRKLGSDGGTATSGRTTENRSSGRLRDALTVVEIALAVVLLVGAGLTLRSLQGLLEVDLGFSTARLFAFKTNLTPTDYPDAVRVNAFYDRLETKLAGLPGVTAVAAVSYLPLSGEASLVSARRPDGSGPLGADAPSVVVGGRAVRGDYFGVMGMTLLRGRLLATSDHAGSAPVTVVDDEFARRFWPTVDDAIGQPIQFGEGPNADTRTVVGVVRHVKHFGPGQDAAPMAYAPQAQLYQRGMYTVLQTSGPLGALIPQIRAQLAEVDPSVPMYFAGTMDQRRAATLALPRFTAGLVSAFSTLALGLAGVGIFGVTAYSVGQRSREFGIRFSLGAQRRDVAGLVLKRVIRLALLGVTIGGLAAIGVATLLKNLLFGVTPMDVPTLAAAVIGMGLTALAASVVPLARALRVNPVEALRAE